MTRYDSLRVEEIVLALEDLGGEANWQDVENLITAERGNSYVPYLDQHNYAMTMSQLYQQHCQGYAKFIGPLCLKKYAPDRFGYGWQTMTCSPNCQAC